MKGPLLGCRLLITSSVVKGAWDLSKTPFSPHHVLNMQALMDSSRGGIIFQCETVLNLEPQSPEPVWPWTSALNKCDLYFPCKPAFRQYAACGVQACYLPAGMYSQWFALLIIRDITYLGDLCTL